VAQKSFLAIGGNNVVVALMSVGQTSVALTSVAKTSVGEKSRHRHLIGKFLSFSKLQSQFNFNKQSAIKKLQ
jgi:hypothetical protein